MALSPERIIAITKKYFETTTKVNVMNDALTTLLGEDFIKAPASNMRDYNNAFEGGLIEHLLKTTSYAVMINKSLPEAEQVDESSLLRVCLLHQIGKAKLFKPCTSDWHIKNLGKMYEFNEDLIPMRISERSLYYLATAGIKLTEEEYSAISNFDKVDDKMSELHNSMLGDLLKMGSVLAIKNEKKIK